MTKFKKYSFWIALAGAILVVADIVGRNMGFIVDETYIMELVTAVLGVLVIVGVITKDDQNSAQSDKNEDISDDNLL